MNRPADHPPVTPPRVGVLIANLGTPDAPETGAVRRYLKQFLSDRRVIEIPPIAWQPILRGIILNTRPTKSAAAYREVWSEEGSPLAAITRRQSESLARRLGPEVLVDWAMRYGNPSVGDALDRLWAAGARRILFAPLYPQYCAATTASAMDALGDWMAGQRWQPAIRSMPPYHDDPHYIDALERDLRRQLDMLDFAPDRLLLSFHGMPERTLHLGDPYHCHCQKTARLLGERLTLDVDIAFQSRFGRAKWLEPATDDRLKAYPGEGVKKIAIAAPGFSADCLETIEELGIRGREDFLAAGGTDFARLDCLNDSAASITMLEALVRRELSGWID
ncbi:ferrochelatase [Sphingomicrobium lutaoense]|uniref:Ferrochelatase n=1 Tax=Sphingomicrobium lutaoense TaxID=515949 RepID=A0A839Z3Z0_9SPHN|nr:ferrochelatase [Sphingomicrobium lutaoense]MBB3764543.1 ferrochelatase [Sphingomicrobium lutaoense]